jgi:hypothetical protein
MVLLAACGLQPDLSANLAPNELVMSSREGLPWYVFGPDAEVQPSSRKLAKLAGWDARLHVAAYASPGGSAALELVEEALPKHSWGELLIPAERRIFGNFAADPSLGEWLILFTDVHVFRGDDPIPRMGYLWRRADVEDYADCGIPALEIDECTLSFFGSSQAVLFDSGSTGRQG